MRQRRIYLTLAALILTVMLTLFSGSASDVYNFGSREPIRGTPLPPTGFQQTAQQLQFGVPALPTVNVSTRWQPLYPLL